MQNKKILFALFCLLALVQLLVPAQMIWNKESTINEGQLFRFKTRPIDPTDPFRGKYITLNFERDSISVSNEKDWAYNETIYLSFKTHEDGFAHPVSISKTAPLDHSNYIKTSLDYISYEGQNKVIPEYSFKRFYMEESKAYEAEQLHRKSQADSSHVTYAVVAIKDGDAVITDLMINGKSVVEIIRARQHQLNGK